MTYLSKQQLAYIQELLNMQETALLIRSKVSVPDNSYDDPETDVDEALDQLEREELDDINAAKRRIERGEYGVCIDCGCEIGEARLTVYPTAKRCMDCQCRHEQREKR